MIQKRYQHYTKDGIMWTEWFNVAGNDEDLKIIQKENKWQMNSKLKNEFRIAPVEEKKETKKKK